MAEDDLVHRRRLERQLVNIFKLFADVVSVEHRVFGGLAQDVAHISHDVGERANVHAEVSVESLYAANRLGSVVIQAEFAILLEQQRDRQEWLEMLLACDRS